MTALTASRMCRRLILTANMDREIDPVLLADHRFNLKLMSSQNSTYFSVPQSHTRS